VTDLGNRVGLLRRREPPITSGSAGYAGTERSRALEGARASSGCSENPMGAADLLQSRWFPDRSKTLGRRFEAVWFAQPPRTQAREGTSGGESRRDGPGMMCFEGGLGRPGTVATEPGRAGSSVLEPAELATSRSSEQEAVEHRG